MLKMPSFSRPLLAALTLAGVGALAPLMMPAKAEAACPKIILTDYYFDAAKTQFAGHCSRMCNNVTTCYGTKTAYTIVETEACGCF